MRQKQILFGLVVVLVLALLYSFWSSPRQGTVSPGEVMRTDGGTSGGALNSKSAVDKQKVNLELLEASKKKYRRSKRDIFNYYTPKPKPTPKPVAKVEPKPLPKPQPKPVITPQVRKQLASFTFLGFLQKDETLTVFLSKRDELFLVKKADYFGEENQFEVVDINEEKMAIRQADASNLIEIVLKEEEPLIPSFSPGEESGISSEKRSTEVAPAINRAPGTSVPPSQRRRQWFKDTQPAPAEQ